MRVHRPHHSPSPRRQRGAVLLVTMIILVVGIAALLVGSISNAALQTERNRKTAEALAQAKEALIGYALAYADRHSNTVDGYLPCPDEGSGTEGSAAGSCGSQNVSRLGRLPWKTLGLPALRDGNGECLWYAVSGTYKNNPMTGLMNWDTGGLLSVNDANGNNTSDVVAVVFSPGVPLSGQDRTPSGSTTFCGGNYTAVNYLDSNGTYNNAAVSGTANATSSFYSGSSSQVNDRMIYITRQDIWNALLKRSDFVTTLTNMTQQAALCIAAYGNNNLDHDNQSLPWPAPLALADYANNASYDDSANLYQGRVPYQVGTSKATTSNQMSGSSLLTTTNCPAGWSTYAPWWSNWKDHLFYAISQEFHAQSGGTGGCGTCLHVNGHGQYAAVVMFAGQALSGQSRSDKSQLSAYLEGRNYSNYPNSGGNSNYEVSSGSTFNDVLYCIDQNLNVAACPP